MADSTHYVELWLGNDQSLYEQAMEVTAATMNEQRSADSPRPNIGAVADGLQELVTSTAEREFPQLFDHGSFVGDIVTNAFASVDWWSVAESWIENVRESERFSTI